LPAFFLSFRNQIADSYPTIFGEPAGDEEPTFDIQTNFSKKWGWYSAIYQIAGGNLLKVDEITTLPLRQCLTFLEFEIDKLEVEKAISKKNQNNY
jgi:hypothetical protein